MAYKSTEAKGRSIAEPGPFRFRGLGVVLCWGRSRAASTVVAMHEIGSRKRSQPAPPHVIFEALTQPNRDPQRPWLLLLDDEVPPKVLKTRHPDAVVWSSLWKKRPDAVIRFDLLRAKDGYGTDLRWTLEVEEPVPDDALVGHMRKRLNELINANLRYSFGQ